MVFHSLKKPSNNLTQIIIIVNIVTGKKKTGKIWETIPNIEIFFQQ